MKIYRQEYQKLECTAVKLLKFTTKLYFEYSVKKNL